LIAPHSPRSPPRTPATPSLPLPLPTSQGVLFVWPDEHSAQQAEATPLPLPHGVEWEEYDALPHYTRRLAYGYEVLAENVVDLSHFPFAHHGVGMTTRDQGKPVSDIGMKQLVRGGEGGGGGVWHSGVWHEGVWHGVCGTGCVAQEDVWHGGVWHGDVWHGDVWHGDVWHGDVWHGDVWHGDIDGGLQPVAPTSLTGLAPNPPGPEPESPGDPPSFASDVNDTRSLETAIRTYRMSLNDHLRRQVRYEDDKRIYDAAVASTPAPHGLPPTLPILLRGALLIATLSPFSSPPSPSPSNESSHPPHPLTYGN
ncbi:unnamed protein product, partial [Closterium sp. NIES-53]